MVMPWLEVGVRAYVAPLRDGEYHDVATAVSGGILFRRLEVAATVTGGPEWPTVDEQYALDAGVGWSLGPGVEAALRLPAGIATLRPTVEIHVVHREFSVLYTDTHERLRYVGAELIGGLDVMLRSDRDAWLFAGPSLGWGSLDGGPFAAIRIGVGASASALGEGNRSSQAEP